MSFVVSLFVIIGQSLLLGLFGYALVPDRKERWKTFNGTKEKKQSKQQKNEQNQSQNAQLTLELTEDRPSIATDITHRLKSTNQSVRLILRKTFLIALILTLINVASVFLKFLSVGIFRMKYLTIILNIVIFLDLAFVFVSFNNWKEILFFPCKKH